MDITKVLDTFKSIGYAQQATILMMLLEHVENAPDTFQKHFGSFGVAMIQQLRDSGE
jgi:hypothetical protein